MQLSYKRIGDYITLVDERNVDLEVTTLLGLSISKQFIPSVANIVGTNMKTYKIIRKNQFACSVMQVRRDGKMPVALLKDFDEAIISQAYPVFEVTDTNMLLPEYLMMWFTRSEFDRQATFHAVGGVRGSLEWEDFMDFEMPIPAVETQQEIVDEYHSITKRIDLNEQLNQKLEETAQTLYKHWFVDFEFPNDNGEPYKSSGGIMDYNEELDGEIPVGWENGCLGDLFQLQRGFDLPTQKRIDGDYPIYASTGISQLHNEYKVKAPGIVTGRSGSLGEVFYVDKDFWPLNTTLWIKEYKNATPLFSYFILKGINIEDYNSGSAVPSLNRNYIHMHELIIPDILVIETFERIGKVLFAYKKENILKNEKLIELQALLLSKMATVGSEEIVTI